MSAVPEILSPDDASMRPRVDGRLVSSRGPFVSGSMGLVAVLSYTGTLLLAHLLDPPSYSVYAAAATMLGTVGVFADALISLPLTAVIRTYPSRSEQRRQGVAFAYAVSAVAGLLAALVIGIVAALFAPPTVVATVAVSALVLFLACPVGGLLNGDLLFVRKALMMVAEICMRVTVSTGVVLLGAGAVGALTGFMAGSAIVFLNAPHGLHREIAWRSGVLRERARWVETGDLALAQLIVYSLVGADVVLVAVLAVHGAESAGYQALSTLAKAPVFVAGGAAAVAFPLLRSQHADTPSILAATLRSFTLLALSSAVIIATAPPELTLLVFPGRYAASLSLLPMLAAAGVGYAGLTMLTTVLLGLRAYRRCQVGLLAAAVLTATGLMMGWAVGGIPGLAFGVAGGTLCAAGVLWVAASPLLPARTPTRALYALLVAGVVGGVLALASRIPVLWVGCVLVLAVTVLLSFRGPKPLGDRRRAVSTSLTERLERAVAGGRGVLVLSAHLDDAVLSCGALLSRLAGRMPVIVATVFTEAGSPPHTHAARRFLKQCGAGDAAGLYADRRQEDVDVLTSLGVEQVHLGVPDALFRRREVAPVVSWLGRFIPELVHRYPTYRFDIAKGRVSRGDRALVDRLEADVSALVDRIDAALVLGPTGVGRHVDHLLTRTLTERQGERAVFYSDFPYDQRDLPDAGYLAAHGLTTVTWDQDLGAKDALIKGYRTQVEALFPEGIPPAVPERYYMASERPGGEQPHASGRQADVDKA